MQHQELQSGRWESLSIAEQLGNIGSEVGRTGKWNNKNERLSLGARDRALELFDLTLSDPRWSVARKTEIARAKELFCDSLTKETKYKTTTQDLERYFMQFSLLARKNI